MKSTSYMFFCVFCIIIMSSGLYASESKNATVYIYEIVQRSPVGKICDIDNINYNIDKYESGMFTISTNCKNSMGKKVKTTISNLHQNDLNRLCVVDGKLLNSKGCLNNFDFINPEKEQEFSQRHTDIVTNESPAGKVCNHIKVYKVKDIDDTYNVYATCPARNERAYFLREIDLYTLYDKTALGLRYRALDTRS